MSFVLITVCAALLYIFEIYMEYNLIGCSNTMLQNLLRTMSTICAILFFLPIVIMIMGNETKPGSKILLAAIASLVILSLVLVLVLFGIKAEYTNCPNSTMRKQSNFPNSIWWTVGALLIAIAMVVNRHAKQEIK